MAIVGKWNYKIKRYDIYNLPDNWNIKLYTDDMDEIINCCQCGAAVKFGECYTSLEVHNNYGLGFAVCDECYRKEWERKNESEGIYENN